MREGLLTSVLYINQAFARRYRRARKSSFEVGTFQI